MMYMYIYHALLPNNSFLFFFLSLFLLSCDHVVIGNCLELPFRYFYRLLSGPEPLSTLEKDRAWHVEEELNLPAMQVS